MSFISCVARILSVRQCVRLCVQTVVVRLCYRASSVSLYGRLFEWYSVFLGGVLNGCSFKCVLKRGKGVVKCIKEGEC